MINYAKQFIKKKIQSFVTGTEDIEDSETSFSSKYKFC